MTTVKIGYCSGCGYILTDVCITQQGNQQGHCTACGKTWYVAWVNKENFNQLSEATDVDLDIYEEISDDVSLYAIDDYDSFFEDDTQQLTLPRRKLTLSGVLRFSRVLLAFVMCVAVPIFALAVLAFPNVNLPFFYFVFFIVIVGIADYTRTTIDGLHA